jgi:hypothetical protein
MSLSDKEARYGNNNENARGRLLGDTHALHIGDKEAWSVKTDEPNERDICAPTARLMTSMRGLTVHGKRDYLEIR